MKLEIESQDVEAIAQKVTELLRPLVSRAPAGEDKTPYSM